jgi:hypothetical protein
MSDLGMALAPGHCGPCESGIPMLWASLLAHVTVMIMLVHLCVAPTISLYSHPTSFQ